MPRIVAIKVTDEEKGQRWVAYMEAGQRRIPVVNVVAPPGNEQDAKDMILNVAAKLAMIPKTKAIIAEVKGT